MIKQEIRLLLSSAKKFIEKLPPAKQQKASINLMKIVQEQKKEEQMLKEIKYQINFLKLTNPSIVFTEEKEVAEEEEHNEQIEQKQTPNQTDLKMGTYIYQNGELIPGKAEKRMQVDYSNWYAANVDPDDLRKQISFILRHKELLDRQHFGGPFWEGKPKPKSILDEENPNNLVYEDERPEKELHPSSQEPRKQIFEKVKR